MAFKKFKVVISQEIIYERIVFGRTQDEAEEYANGIFKLREEDFIKFDSQFEVIDISEVK